MNDAQRLIVFSVVLLMAFTFPAQYLHELAHAAVCAAERHEYRLNIGLAFSSVRCFGTFENDLLYYASGGVVAGIAFFALGFMPFLSVRIATWSIAVGNALAGMMEGFFREVYFSLEGYIAVQIFSVLIFIFLLYGLGLSRIKQEGKAAK